MLDSKTVLHLTWECKLSVSISVLFYKYPEIGLPDHMPVPFLLVLKNKTNLLNSMFSSSPWICSGGQNEEGTPLVGAKNQEDQNVLLTTEPSLQP